MTLDSNKRKRSIIPALQPVSSATKRALAMLFGWNTGSGFPERRRQSEKLRDVLSCSFFTNERPHPLSGSTFTAEISDPGWVQGRLRRLLLTFARETRFSRCLSLIFLISPGWFSFLSRPTTFLRDQNRGAPLFASRESRKDQPASLLHRPFCQSAWSFLIPDFMLILRGPLPFLHASLAINCWVLIVDWRDAL